MNIKGNAEHAQVGVREARSSVPQPQGQAPSHVASPETFVRVLRVELKALQV